MHYKFQSDLLRLKLMIANAYAKTVNSHSNPEESNLPKIKLEAKVKFLIYSFDTYFTLIFRLKARDLRLI